MPRPRKVVPPAETPAPEPPPPPAEAGDAPTVRRRRRRRTTAAAPDYASETIALVDAVLKGRGSRGATPDTLQSVVNWARTVRTEGETLKELSSRPRRQKTQAPGDRIAKYEMNRALLDGVIAGTLALDIQDDGSLVFLHANAAAPAAPPDPLPSDVTPD